MSTSDSFTWKKCCIKWDLRYNRVRDMEGTRITSVWKTIPRTMEINVGLWK